jgi:choline dehydrogenase-like flavoprotein
VLRLPCLSCALCLSHAPIRLAFIPKSFAPGIKPNTPYATILAAVERPFGTGSIHINTSSPTAYPVINPHYLETGIDRLLSFSATKAMMTLLQTPPFSYSVAAPFIPAKIKMTDAEITDYVNKAIGTSSHPIGTASLFPRSDGGVVDPNLKVYGTTNVRVVDASVIPQQICAHSQATVYGVAELGASLIKKAHS